MTNENKPPMFGPSAMFDPSTHEPRSGKSALMNELMASSTKFRTPDGQRYATVIDGAHVIGDVEPTEQGIEAIRDLLAAARKRIEADGLVQLQTTVQKKESHESKC